MNLSEIMARCSQQGECRLWNGAVNNRGAARVCAPKKLVDAGLFPRSWSPARQVVWAMRHGKKPEGVLVMSCRNPLCLNHQHMLDMSRADSVRWHAAGGAYKTVRHKVAGVATLAKQRKLTREAAHEIRTTLEKFTAKKSPERAAAVRELAAKFGLHKDAIYGVARGRYWAVAPVANSSVWAMAA